MNEVAAATGALLLDALDQRGMDPAVVWAGLPITREMLRQRGGRFDWETWVAMCARAEQHAPVPMEELFVAGAGSRSGHPFVRIAGSLLSVRDLYAFLARWGIRRNFTNARGSFEMQTSTKGRFTMTVNEDHPGSVPTMKFLAGMLRGVPSMQGHPAADVAIMSASGHHAEYSIELPVERSLVARGRRLLRGFNAISATLDELETQANEIALKNDALEKQLADARERDEWLDIAMSAGSVGVWRWDPETRRVRISPILATWLGVPGQVEVDTTIWGQNVHPEDRPALVKTMAAALETRRSYEYEYRIIRPNGDVMWLTVAGKFQNRPDGRSYAYGSAKDITEKKLLEEQLRLADRTIAAGTLAAGIAHEINNPLTYVIGSLDLMERRLAQYPGAAEATADLLAQALDGCDRIRDVVSDVRTFARHDDNVVIPVDPRAVCQAAMRIVSSDIRHRATIETDFATDTPFVLANNSRLGQVMINLIVNATQAMPADRTSDLNRIVIRTRHLPNGAAAIEVEDNGSGIHPDVVPRVFDPFFTTKPVGVGTGLGLSVCQGIVTALGGRIELASTEGRGSKFTVTLASAPPDEQSAGIDAPRPTASASRVLVIDDEPMIRDVVARTLTAQGFTVDEAQSGREGLARAVGEDHYDAILCDLMMPDLDGVALHRELARERPELASRMVFISGGAITARTQEFLQTPGVVVLHKPFAFERLVEAIERAVRPS